jgi:transcriptional antiterminator NusG
MTEQTQAAEVPADLVPVELATLIEAPTEAAAKPAAGAARMRWYILHAYSGFEKKIALAIKEKAVQQGIADKIEEVVVPSEDIMELRRGKKVAAERKFFPGYVLVKMILTDETWHMVKNIDKVTGFLGGNGRPQPVPQSEVDNIFKRMSDGAGAVNNVVFYEVGESVKITDGPFDSFTGVVEEVDHDREKVKVSVAIFGRATPVELDYGQVSKV